jgi:hypothetical protein
MKNNDPIWSLFNENSVPNGVASPRTPSNH